MTLRILYLGDEGGTSLDRANAYRRLGHAIEHIDVRSLLPQSRWVDRITLRVGGHAFTPMVRTRLERAIGGRTYDLCHVNSGEWVGPGVIDMLRRYAPLIINYNNDDPLGQRDRRRFATYRAALPHYDAVFVVRLANVSEAYRCGARQVCRVWMSADEVTHAPRGLTVEDHRRWDCEVLFLGTWMPERGPFLVRLVELGVPLTIRGGRWDKAPEWADLRPYWKGPAVVGDDYAKAIQCARVNLGLLSKGNRDLHTTRSIEIPAVGGLLCAERTTEHISMYHEGEEAVFWSGPEECASACASLLADESRRQGIVARGRERVLRNRHFNQDVMNEILRYAATCRSMPQRAI